MSDHQTKVRRLKTVYGGTVLVRWEDIEAALKSAIPPMASVKLVDRHGMYRSDAHGYVRSALRNLLVDEPTRGVRTVWDEFPDGTRAKRYVYADATDVEAM